MLILGVWVVGRVAALWQEFGMVRAPRAPLHEVRRGTARRTHNAIVLRASPPPPLLADINAQPPFAHAIRARPPAYIDPSPPQAREPVDVALSAPPSPAVIGDTRQTAQPDMLPQGAGPHLSPAVGQPVTSPRHLSVSGWALVRAAGQRGLSDAGQLGGSQAGVRGYYALGASPVRLTTRFSAPLGDPIGKGAAFGVAVRPLKHVPLTIIVEQRVAADSGGRNDLELIATGGLYDHALGHHLTLSGYLQTGIVGVKRRDAFIDGSAEIEHPLAHLKGARLTFGGGIWGAAQPGVARLDAGPTAALHFRIGAVSAKAEASYRFRLLGAARPATGPAFSIGTDF